MGQFAKRLSEIRRKTLTVAQKLTLSDEFRPNAFVFCFYFRLRGHAAASRISVERCALCDAFLTNARHLCFLHGYVSLLCCWCSAISEQCFHPAAIRIFYAFQHDVLAGLSDSLHFCCQDTNIHAIALQFSDALMLPTLANVHVHRMESTHACTYNDDLSDSPSRVHT